MQPSAFTLGGILLSPQMPFNLPLMAINYGDNSVAVGQLQGILGVLADDSFGPKTASALIARPEVQSVITSLLAGSTVVTPPLNPSGPTLGIDIYHGDSISDWGKILGAGYAYAFIKASDGSSHDPQFINYFTQAKAHGFLAGGYHFYEPSISVQTQVDAIISGLNAAGWVSGIDLPPVLDFETFSAGDPTASDYANANTFLRTLQTALKVKVIIYGSDSVIVNAPSWIASDIVWDARYGATPKYPNWTFFQNSGSASVPGLNNGSAGSDTDIFNGSLADLRSFVASSKLA